MRRKKKISLIYWIWGLHIKSWSWYMFRGRQMNLPDGLLHQPKLFNVLRHSSFFSRFLHSWQSLPKAFRAIVDSWKFSFHFIIVHKKSGEHLGCTGRKAVVLLDQALDYAPFCIASKHNLRPSIKFCFACSSTLSLVAIQSRSFVRLSWYFSY